MGLDMQTLESMLDREIFIVKEFGFFMYSLHKKKNKGENSQDYMMLQN